MIDKMKIADKVSIKNYDKVSIENYENYENYDTLYIYFIINDYIHVLNEEEVNNIKS